MINVKEFLSFTRQLLVLVVHSTMMAVCVMHIVLDSRPDNHLNTHCFPVQTKTIRVTSLQVSSEFIKNLLCRHFQLCLVGREISLGTKEKYF